MQERAVTKEPSDSATERRPDGTSSAALPSALDRLPEIAALMAARRVALFLDYDGTLTPIAARPELAVLGPDTRALLDALAARCTLAIVSGRDVRDVRKLVDLDSLIYAGSHGFEIDGPQGWHLEHEQEVRCLPALDAAEAALQAALAAFEGVIVERKHFSVAVHYRLAADGDTETIKATVAAVGAQHPELRSLDGKKVRELRPAVEWNKGRAVTWMLDKLGLRPPEALPIYIGDDVTDEDAFRALGDSALGIVVRDHAARQTDARYALDDPTEVQTFLRFLCDELDA